MIEPLALELCKTLFLLLFHTPKLALATPPFSAAKNSSKIKPNLPMAWPNGGRCALFSKYVSLCRTMQSKLRCCVFEGQKTQPPLSSPVAREKPACLTFDFCHSLPPRLAFKLTREIFQSSVRGKPVVCSLIFGCFVVALSSEENVGVGRRLESAWGRGCGTYIYQKSPANGPAGCVSLSQGASGGKLQTPRAEARCRLRGRH